MERAPIPELDTIEVVDGGVIVTGPQFGCVHYQVDGHAPLSKIITGMKTPWNQPLPPKLQAEQDINTSKVEGVLWKIQQLSRQTGEPSDSILERALAKLKNHENHP